MRVNGWPSLIEGVNGDRDRPGDVAGDVRQGQAALFIGLGLAGGLAQDGVDEHAVVLGLAGGVGHEQPPGYPHLWPRQTDAGRGVHELKHSLSHFTHLLVHMLHRFGAGPERRARGSSGCEAGQSESAYARS